MRGYQRAVVHAPIVLPLAAITLLFANPGTPAYLRGLHAVGIAFGMLFALFLAYVAYACYRRDNEPLLKYVALAYLAFAILEAPLSFIAIEKHAHLPQLALFEQAARLVALLYLLHGAILAGKPPNSASPSARFEILIHGLALVLLAAALYGWSGRGHLEVWHVNTIKVLALIVPIASIVVLARTPEKTLLTRFNRLAHLFFAQASLAFLLEDSWTALWWLGHVLSTSGLVLLGYGLTRLLLRSRSYTNAYEGLMQRDLMEKVVEFSPVGILLVDADLRHIRCNQMLEGMLGSPEPEAHMTALLDHMRLTPAVFVETMSRSPMLVRHFDTAMGRHYEVRIAAVGLGGKAQAYICVLIDRSSAHKSEEEIRALNTSLAREVAERSSINADMETFVYSVSHDLRAPLRAITGFSHIMEEEHKNALNEEALFLLQKISASAHHMRQLIDGLLTYARLGRAHVSRAPVDMRVAAAEAVQQVREASGLHATEVEIGDLPSVSGDHALLMQVWVNLLANAFKFSAKASTPRIEISGLVEGDQAIYCVRDNGVGFDMRFVERLFGVFQRLHKQSEFEGTGVGLAIAQRIVGKHEGRMHAESKEGEGAAFYFSLPLRPK